MLEITKYKVEGSILKPQCPKCQDGTLELLSEKELQRLKSMNLGDNISDRIYGCDECKYWIDAKEIENS